MNKAIDERISSLSQPLKIVRRERTMLISLAVLMLINVAVVFGIAFHNHAEWSGAATQLVASYAFWTALSLYAFRRVRLGLGHRVMLVLLLTMAPCAIGVLLLIGFVVWWRVWAGIPIAASFVLILGNWVALVILEVQRRALK